MLRRISEGTMDTEQSIQKFYHKFLSEAPYESLKDGDPWVMPQDIPWFDAEKYNRGRKHMKDYSLIVFTSVIIAAMIVPGVKPIGKVFHSYGDFNPMYRYLLTRTKVSYRMLSMYIGDMLKRSGKGIKHARIAKGVHHRAKYRKVNVQLPQDIPEEYHRLAKSMRDAVSMVDTSDLSDDVVEWDAEPFSQFYCSMTYFVFYSILWTNPTISSSLPQEVKDEITYVYGVWGRLMPGIRDEYNVALHRDQEFIRKLACTVYGKILLHSDPTSTMFLYQSFRGAQTLSLGILNANALLAFFVRDIYDSHEKEELVEKLSVHEKRMLNCYDKFIALYLQNSVFRIAINLLIQFLNMVSYILYPIIIRFQAKSKKQVSNPIAN